MAISAAVGVGKKIVGKAISAAKKKKKDLETKGRRIKQKKVKDELTNAKFKSAIDPNKAAIDADKATRKIMKTPDIVAGVGASAAQTGKKAIKAAKPTIDKIKPTIDKTKSKVKDLNKKINKTVEKAPVITGIIAGTLGTSVLASASKVSYTYKKMPDGQIQVNLIGDKNKNTFMSPRHLNPKEIDDVRINMDMLESIVVSDDPQKRKKEFTNIVSYLNEKYKINQIQGKNLSIMLPRE
tara:strand:+ start:63 stop:779 length:717 start_codon:yes stop_codon:yes gene_type:complete